VILHEVTSAQSTAFLTLLSRLGAFPNFDITFTFDDGFYSSYEVICGLQDRKAMFFICPGFINTASDSLAAETFVRNNLLRTDNFANTELREAVRPATWDDLRHLIKLGHTIGSHTMNHTRLSKIISYKELEYEIIGSANMIEDALQIKVDSFAFPFGTIKSINERAYSIIKKRYTYCFTGVRGNNSNNTNSYIRWRDTIDLSWPSDYIEFVLKGGLDWRYWLKRRRASYMVR